MSCITFLSPPQRTNLRASTKEGQPLSAFASPPATTSKINRLRKLATSTTAEIRESAALAQNAPEDVLSLLADDPIEKVRCCVARNTHTPEEVLRALATDPVAHVRGWVAANPSTPPELRTYLTNDTDPTVQAVCTWATR